MDGSPADQTAFQALLKDGRAQSVSRKSSDRVTAEYKLQVDPTILSLTVEGNVGIWTTIVDLPARKGYTFEIRFNDAPTMNIESSVAYKVC